MRLAKKLLWAVLALVGVAMVAVLVAVVSTSIRPARAIGVEQVLATDPGHPPVPVTILYPTTAKPRWTWFGIAAVKLASEGPVDGERLPLVVISHGTAGTSMSHIDTMLALVEAGYVVAAPLHTGDNFQDDSKVGTPDWMVDRARQIARVNDFMLGSWQGRRNIDAGKVGLFGFSAGGTTGLIAIGGTPDMARIGPYCAEKPEFVCKLLKPQMATPLPPVSAWTHDPRIRAAVIVAPGFGFAFAPEGLSAAKVPVQLWAGDADVNVPLASNARVVRDLLPVTPEFHVVPRAGHFSFLPPCGPVAPLLPPMLCTDPTGFERGPFQRRFNKAVVTFFNAHLGGS